MEQFPDFIKTTGYGDILGLGGVNCRHSFWGTRKEYAPQYSKEELQKLNNAALETKEWTNQRGETKKYNQYEAEQQMRRMENRMRQTRSLAAGLREGNDEQGYTEQRARYMSQRTEYKRFASEMELREDFQRVYNDGIGRL